MTSKLNFYTVGKAILSHYTTFKSKTMIQKLAEVMKPGEKLTIGLSFREGEVVMTIQPFSLQSKKSFSPFAASGPAESLEEEAVAAFIAKLNELNPVQLHVETTAMEESAKEEKKPEPKKSQPKTAPAKKEKPAKVQKPKLTAIQQKAMAKVTKMADRVSDFKTFDQDMFNYLKKEAVKEATEANLDMDVVDHLFEEAKEAVLKRAKDDGGKQEVTVSTPEEKGEEGSSEDTDEETDEETSEEEEKEKENDVDDLPFKEESEAPEIVIEQEEIPVPEKELQPEIQPWAKPVTPPASVDDDEDIY